MDLQQRIQLIIDGNNTKANKALQETRDNIQQLPKEAAVQGKATGDKFGQEMARAQDRWMKVGQGFLRQYFGVWGAGLANVLEHYDKIGKAIESTKKASTLRDVTGAAAGGAAAGRVASHASGDVVGEVAGSAIGSGAGVLGAPVARSKWIQTIEQRKYANQMALGFGRKPPNPGAIETTLEFLGKGIKNIGLKTGIGAGAILAGLGAITGIAARSAKKNEEREAEIASIRQLVKELEKIKDPIEKTKAIIKELGNDGQAEYRKLTEELKKYKTEQDTSTQSIRDFQAVALDLWEAIEGAGRAVGRFFRDVATGTLDTFSQASNGILKMFGIESTARLRKEIKEGEAISERLQKKLDQKRVERVKKDEEERKAADKALEDLVDAQDDYTDAVEKTAFANADNVKQVELLKKKQQEYSQALMWTERGTIQFNKLLKDQLSLQQDIKAAKKEANQEAITKGDQKRLSLNELAGLTGKTASQIANIKKAQQILKLEDDLKNLIAGGDQFNAEKLRKQSQQLRRELGQSGVLQSSDFSVESQKFSNRKSITLREMLALNPDLAPDYQKLFALQNAMMNPSLSFKQSFTLKEQMDAVQAKITETLQDRRSNDATTLMAEEFKKKGALPVIPFNGR